MTFEGCTIKRGTGSWTEMLIIISMRAQDVRLYQKNINKWINEQPCLDGIFFWNDRVVKKLATNLTHIKGNFFSENYHKKSIIEKIPKTRANEKCNFFFCCIFSFFSQIFICYNFLWHNSMHKTVDKYDTWKFKAKFNFKKFI